MMEWQVSPVPLAALACVDWSGTRGGYKKTAWEAFTTIEVVSAWSSRVAKDMETETTQYVVFQAKARVGGGWKWEVNKRKDF